MILFNGLPAIGFGAVTDKHWFIWWVSRMEYVSGRWIDRGSWYGMQYLTDREAWRLEIDIIQSHPGSRPYRWMWNGEEWRYDTRSNVEMSAVL